MLGLAIAAGLGMLSVALISDRTELTVRQLGGSARAELHDSRDSGVSEGDPRIVWTSLPTSLSAPLVADGATVWVAVAERLSEAGPFESGVYRYSPQAGELLRVAGFWGRPTAAVLAGSDLAVGVGQEVILVSPAGSVRHIVLERGKDPLGGASYITALEYQSGRLFAAINTSTNVEEIDLKSGATVRTFNLGAEMPTPQHLVALDSDTLLASTPFGSVDGMGPGSVAINLASGRVSKVNLGKPFGFSRDASGRIATTQAVPGGGVRRILDASATPPETAPGGGDSIPWNGRWDLLAIAPDGSVWGAVAGTDRVFRQRATGEVDEFLLPTISVTPSIPEGAQMSEEEEVRLGRATRNVTSMVALPDGSLVFLSESPGGALGYVAAQ